MKTWKAEKKRNATTGFTVYEISQQKFENVELLMKMENMMRSILKVCSIKFRTGLHSVTLQ